MTVELNKIKKAFIHAIKLKVFENVRRTHSGRLSWMDDLSDQDFNELIAKYNITEDIAMEWMCEDKGWCRFDRGWANNPMRKSAQYKQGAKRAIFIASKNYHFELLDSRKSLKRLVIFEKIKK